MKNLPSLLRNIALAAVTLSLSATLHAQTLNAFNFYGDTNGSTSTTNATGAGPATLSLGAGLSFITKFSNGYAVNPDGPDSLAQAETAGEYISISLAPGAGYTENLTSLNFIVASFGGATDFALTDTSNNILASGTATTSVPNSDGTNYNEAGTLSFGSGGVTISAATTFRLYLYGNQLTDPNGDFGDDYDLVFNSGSNNDSLVVDGTATPLPEPSTYALFGLGALILVLRVGYARRQRSI